MRVLLSTIVLSFILFSCGKEGEKAKETLSGQVDSAGAVSAKPLDTVNVSKFKFEETEFDFGSIKEGEVVHHVFKFTNVGKTDLIINNARGSCGCTIPSYPKEPILVGESGEIEVQFNSKNKAGANQKFVSIVANTYPEVTSISIKANVQPKEGGGETMAK